ncbi:N-acetylmuramic acid 6-phosphate etherase [Paenibacillus chitinolyticus]
MKENIHSLTTEQQNPRTRQLDQRSALDIVTLINQEDLTVAETVRQVLPAVAEAVDWITQRLSAGGRLFYFGAGTSGRLGILDASECPPTYGTDPKLIQGIIAGGPDAILKAVEGAEDSEQLGRDDADACGVSSKDVVVGIAASGRTPYVIGAMKRAREQGAKVIALCNNHGTPMAAIADLAIEPVVGPEVVLGSTRMKAGTAQKMVLNMLTTASMVRLGKVYDNLMVDVQPSNYKLVERAKRLIAMATGSDSEEISRAYVESQGHVKTAIVMILAKMSYEEASRRLQETGGKVRMAVESSESAS